MSTPEVTDERRQLTRLAYRMLGSVADAEDVVQEAYARWYAQTDEQRDAVESPGAWLTKVASRICLDVLRSARVRRESYVGEWLPEPLPGSAPAQTGDPADRVALDESIGMAFLVVLESMTPAERVAFVLHDMFAVPFEEIAPVIGRSVEAARQLASRARRRVQGGPPERHVGQARRRKIVEAFISASRGGDFAALLELLDPEVVMRGDAAAIRLGGGAEIRGAEAVARFFDGRARAAKPALVDEVVDVAVVPRGRLLLVLRLEVRDDRIFAIHAVADPDTLARSEIVLLDD